MYTKMQAVCGTSSVLSPLPHAMSLLLIFTFSVGGKYFSLLKSTTTSIVFENVNVIEAQKMVTVAVYGCQLHLIISLSRYLQNCNIFIGRLYLCLFNW